MEIITCLLKGIEYWKPLIEVLTLLFLIWVTYETFRMRKGQEKLFKKILQDEQPNIMISFEEGKTHRDIYIVIENIGKNPAYDLKFSINPKFEVKIPVFNMYVNENKALTEGIRVLKGGNKMKIYATSTIDTAAFFQAGEITTDYTFTVTYKNNLGDSFNTEIVDSLTKFFTRLGSGFKSHKTRALESIEQSLQVISNKFPEPPTKK